MNRHDRRALRHTRPLAAASPRGPEFPPGYLALISKVAAILRAHQHEGCGVPSCFYLPPKDVRLLGAIEGVAHVVARDETSRELLRRAIELARGDLSPFMFDIACEFAGVEVQRVPLSDFGSLRPLSGGSGGTA